jgi:uncharacterized linocin/CFP29 family protein
MKLVTELDVRQAQAQRELIFALAKRVYSDRTELYLQIRDFRDAVVVGGRRKWELVGYKTWEEFREDVCKITEDGRAGFYQKLRAVSVLPAETVKQLGWKKSFQAARLKKAGKLTRVWVDKLEQMDTDHAVAAVQKEVSRVDEVRQRLMLYPRASQVELFESEEQRFFKVTGESTREVFFDFMLGQISSLSEKQIQEEHEGKKQG